MPCFEMFLLVLFPYNVNVRNDRICDGLKFVIARATQISCIYIFFQVSHEYGAIIVKLFYFNRDFFPKLTRQDHYMSQRLNWNVQEVLFLSPRCARSVRHDLEPNIFPSVPPTQSIMKDIIK